MYRGEEPDESVKSIQVYLALKVDQLLDFEDITLYIFQLTATDGDGNATYPASVQIVVQVEDISDEPPVWINFVYSRRITEEQEEVSNFILFYYFFKKTIVDDPSAGKRR